MKTTRGEICVVEYARCSEHGQYAQNDDDHDQFDQRKATLHPWATRPKDFGATGQVDSSHSVLEKNSKKTTKKNIESVWCTNTGGFEAAMKKPPQWAASVWSRAAKHYCRVSNTPSRVPLAGEDRSEDHRLPSGTVSIHCVAGCSGYCCC